MLLLIATIISILMAVFGGILFYLDRRSNTKCWITVSGIVGIVFLGAICSILYMGNLQDRAKLEAFYESNARNYRISTSTTETYLSEEIFTEVIIQGSVEKIGIGEQLAQRIVEWRNSINDYNTQLKMYQSMSDNIFTGLFYPRIPESLTPLYIQSIEGGEQH